MRGVLAVIFAGGCAAAFAATQTLPKAGGLLRVRFGGDQAETRIVVDLERSASGRVMEAEGGPTRMVVALSDVGSVTALQGRGQGLVKAWMVTNGAQGARLSLDLAQGAQVKRRFLLPPADGVSNYRYVIDIAAAASAPPKAPSSAALIAARQELIKADDAVAAADPPPLPLPLKKVVVIDAGHGGHDPGAQSASTNEKDVTLAAARALKARLERSGRYQVVMTRDSDVYVPLETRVQIARRAGADLFISLHADSSGGDPGTHGASVYTLSEQGGARVTRVMNRNEWYEQTGAKADDPAVGQILLDLTQRSTRNRSAVFAQVLVSQISHRVDLLPRSHRDAGYFVLLAPDVPAALLEMGFITSPEDEERLTDPARRGKLMDSVAQAIDAYFGAQTRLAAR